GDFDSGSTAGNDIFHFEKHNNNCWSSHAKMNNHSITRKFSTPMGADFFTPHLPQRPPGASDTAPSQAMLGYESMQMDAAQWSKPSFQHPSAPSQPQQQMASMNNSSSSQRKISMPPLDIAIGSPAYEPPPTLQKAVMDQNPAPMMSPQTIIKPTAQIKLDDSPMEVS
ncbi:hypothetical protein GCK32_009182, partial [Trichostrongylus colubriformis]